MKVFNINFYYSQHLLIIFGTETLFSSQKKSKCAIF